MILELFGITNSCENLTPELQTVSPEKLHIRVMIQRNCHFQQLYVFPYKERSIFVAKNVKSEVLRCKIPKQNHQLQTFWRKWLKSGSLSPRFPHPLGDYKGIGFGFMRFLWRALLPCCECSLPSPGVKGLLSSLLFTREGLPEDEEMCSRG